MNFDVRYPSWLVLFAIATGGVWFEPLKVEANESDALTMPDDIRALVDSMCVDCHSGESAEAGIRFDQFATLRQEAKLDLLNRAQDQLFFDLMPPEDGEQLNEAMRQRLTGWLRQELRSRKASMLDEKLREPAYGNYVQHERLFDGSLTEKPFTPARRWLVSPQIFHERVNAIFKLEGRSRQTKFYGVTNPIVLPDHSGVRYYDTATLDGGHLLVMLNNAQWIANKQIFAATHQGEDRRKLEFPNPKDNWFPAYSPEAFVVIARKESLPTKQEMIAAIHAQFDCVLQRDATQSDLDEYLPLLKSSIELGGNVEGLRQMLISVLLKSEFLYRLEFGAGEPDEFGRLKLSPRETAYAIAYAIDDRIPDEQLFQAAQEGRLSTKEDIRREVTRLLNDEQSFYGEADPTLSGITIHGSAVTHPKINRFFREFFGYPDSTKLFKDVARSGGFYDNLERGYSGTAGSVTAEADLIIDSILREDQDVFARLLTTDEYFVLRSKSAEEGRKLVEQWRLAYEGLKDTDWRNNTERALLDNFEEHKKLFEFLRIQDLREDRRRVHVRDFHRFMTFFENTFGKGITPITYPWFFHGGQKYRHSEIYNLPHVAGAGPLDYDGVYARGEYPDIETWDYPLEQPFQLAHRKGILTHPAWLLAHSQNTTTDPVRRGRWIREKLLAGRVPDVPITVDAQIPEDLHRTLRQRLDTVTTQQACWKCHQQMNPLGLTFEIFDDFGRYRTEESLEHPENIIQEGDGERVVNVYETRPVDATGALTGTGDPALDGDVQDAFDLIDRLAKSERVRQSIIRHAFRYFMAQTRYQLERRVLKFLSNDESSLAAQLSGIEQRKVGNYADAIMDIQQRNARVEAMGDVIRQHIPQLDAKYLAEDLTTVDRQNGLVEVLLSTLISGMTNVVAFTADELGTPYTGLPGIEGENVNLHDVGHGKSFGGWEALDIREKVRHQHMKLIDRIVSRLKSVPEGKGTMFDNTMLFYLPNNGETHHSKGTEWPFIVLAGNNARLDIARRYIRLPGYNQFGHKTLGNWYTTILNAYGNPVSHYGALDVALTIDQKGPIKQFLG